MASLNKVILIGNLGKDPETRTIQGGNTCTTFSLATMERWGGGDDKKEKTEWHNIVAWGKVGELAAKYLSKGRSVYIEGKITSRSWDDKDGNKRYKTEIVALSIQFLSPAKKDGGDRHDADEPLPEAPTGYRVSPDGVVQPAGDKDLPF
jgi:single-strand DNA-binding protein